MGLFRNCGIARPRFLGTLWHDVSRSTDCAEAALFLTPEESGDAPVVKFFVYGPVTTDRTIRACYDVVFRNRFRSEPRIEVALWVGKDEGAAQAWARAAEIAKTIATQVADNPVLRAVRRFADLHDHCDANCLGEQEAFLDSCGWTGHDDATDQAALAASTEVLNDAQDIVDYWLRTRQE